MSSKLWTSRPDLSTVEPVEPREPGRWGRVPSEASTELTALRWERAETLRARVLRAINVPTVLAIVVFGIAVVATALIMLRGLVDAPAEDIDAATQVDQPSDALTESDTAVISGLGEGTQNDTGTGSSADTVFVHVVGEVESPGVFELSRGRRVADAIDAAGGPTPQAGIEAINLARVLGDGEQVYVPDHDTAAAILSSPDYGSSHPSPQSLPEGLVAAPGTSASVNVNLGTAEQLQQLPGIGPALAQRIIDWRETNGGFSSLDQLLEVSGIGPKTLVRFRDQVSL